MEEVNLPAADPEEDHTSLSNSNVGFLGSSAGKESTCNERDPGLISGSGRSTGEGRWLR